MMLTSTTALLAIIFAIWTILATETFRTNITSFIKNFENAEIEFIDKNVGSLYIRSLKRGNEERRSKGLKTKRHEDDDDDDFDDDTSEEDEHAKKTKASKENIPIDEASRDKESKDEPVMKAKTSKETVPANEADEVVLDDKSKDVPAETSEDKITYQENEVVVGDNENESVKKSKAGKENGHMNELDVADEVEPVIDTEDDVKAAKTKKEKQVAPDGYGDTSEEDPEEEPAQKAKASKERNHDTKPKSHESADEDASTSNFLMYGTACVLVLLGATIAAIYYSSSRERNGYAPLGE